MADTGLNDPVWDVTCSASEHLFAAGFLPKLYSLSPGDFD
jgi:hypothetical protein